MINMMNDILQYLPYALFVGAIFALLIAGVAVTFFYFRKSEQRAAKFPASKRKIQRQFKIV